ncbi:ABC transporter substrate-binding protein [Hyperthermus butylicus]|uniref:Conserved archaeal protein n=1 Tax=Hyperthermus butylicus (strain DSM 5456 / JCM 9403 / PLM1-5) TaxID=415426 RepID=A2BL15_HYPBU|nr:ABC transporter substrate-binding protein [Hyperthermus butylicus]ABM80676.1 conserved archaeal protein [Hyperthermus butylicus DSM 5456]
MRKLIALILIAVFVLPSLGVAITAQAQGEKGPASDKVIWKQVTLEQVVQALKSGDIDVYLFGLRPAAAQQLVGEKGIELYQAPAGLVDLGLNPAPVMIVELPGKLTKEEAATKLGVDPVVIAYATYVPSGAEEVPPVGVSIEDRDITVVELCAKIPETSVTSAGGKVLWQSDKFDINPFCFKEIRFAMNYLVDRDYIVKNIYKGFAIARYAVYGAGDPTYVEVIDVVAKYKFSYNPTLAKEIVFSVLQKAGAEYRDGVWYYNGKPIQVIGIIRQEDERLDIGKMFADELEKTIGIKVLRQIVPFGEAITKVYASDPKDFEWHFYTEGWGRGAIDRWDPWMVTQFAAPWFGWVVGWAEPTWWNYRNDTIDEYSKIISLGGFKSKEEFIDLLKKATELSIQESLRIWIVSTLDTYPARSEVKGVTLDLGAGLRSPFFIRGAYVAGGDGTLKVGHRWVFTARTIWNPFGGFDDVYSVDPARATYDPGIWRHPFNGEPIAFRTPFTVETAGPEGKLPVPDDAVWWDAENDRWVYAKDLGRIEAVSKVVFDVSKLVGSKWHDGEPITFADIMAWLAENLDITYDPQKSQIEGAIASTAKEIYEKIVAFRFLPSENKVEVYVDYWHFDPNYIADFAAFTLYNPAPVIFAMDYLAFVKKTYALDETRARKENIPQLNLVLADHAAAIKEALDEISYDAYKGYFTLPDGTVLMTPDEWADRIEKAKAWIDTYGNAWISDGPFKLVKFDKDAQMLELEAFRDPTYPFGPTDWVFGLPAPVTITGIKTPLVPPGKEARIIVTVAGPSPLHVKYVLRDPETNKVIAVGEAEETPGGFLIKLPASLTATLAEYSVYDLTVIAYSESVALPAEQTVSLQTTETAGKIEQVQENIQKQIEQLRQLLGEQVASAISNAISGVNTQIQDLLKTVQQLPDTLKSSISGLATKDDVATATNKAAAAESKANLALIVSVINLILLLAIAYGVFARRS